MFRLSRLWKRRRAERETTMRRRWRWLRCIWRYANLERRWKRRARRWRSIPDHRRAMKCSSPVWLRPARRKDSTRNSGAGRSCGANRSALFRQRTAAFQDLAVLRQFLLGKRRLTQFPVEVAKEVMDLIVTGLRLGNRLPLTPGLRLSAR